MRKHSFVCVSKYEAVCLDMKDRQQQKDGEIVNGRLNELFDWSHPDVLRVSILTLIVLMWRIG